KFSFPAIPAAKQPTYFLLHGLFNVPMRHSQSGYWDVTRNRYDMSMGRFHGAPPDRCQLLWLDPQEFAGKRHFLVDGEGVASAELVERVQAKKLTGLVLHPIKYRPMSRPVIKPLKRIISAPPKPDFLAAAKGFSPAIGKQWLALWNWTVEALINRGW